MPLALLKKRIFRPQPAVALWVCVPLAGCTTTANRASRLPHPEFSSTRVAALRTGMTPTETEALFGSPDEAVAKQYGQKTATPWEGLVHKYRMGLDPRFAMINEQLYNELVFSISGKQPRLNHFELPRVYPDSQVPAYASLPPLAKVTPDNAQPGDSDDRSFPNRAIERAYALWDEGRLAEGKEILLASLPYARSDQFVYELVIIYSRLGVTSLCLGQAAEATQYLRQAIALAKQRPDKLGDIAPRLVAHCQSDLGAALMLDGKLTDAEQQFLEATALLETGAWTTDRAYEHCQEGLAEIYTKQGKYAQAEALLRRRLAAVELEDRPDKAQQRLFLRIRLQTVLRGLGRNAEADALIARDEK